MILIQSKECLLDTQHRRRHASQEQKTRSFKQIPATLDISCAITMTTAMPKGSTMVHQHAQCDRASRSSAELGVAHMRDRCGLRLLILARGGDARPASGSPTLTGFSYLSPFPRTGEGRPDGYKVPFHLYFCPIGCGGYSHGKPDRTSSYNSRRMTTARMFLLHDEAYRVLATLPSVSCGSSLGMQS